jgi:hypothetical protein
MAGNPRIQEARQRAAGAKRALAVVSVAGFLAAFVLARVSHPGHAHLVPSSTGANASQSSGDDTTANFGFGSSSIAPSQGGAPSVQSSTS